MASRANWKGYFQAFPRFPSTRPIPTASSLRKTKQQNVDFENGVVVLREDTARGYEIGKDHYLIVEDDELDAIQIESTRTIDIDHFVPRSDIDERYIDPPYFIAPDGQVGKDAYAVIRDTIGKMNMALGRVVLTRREKVIRPLFSSPESMTLAGFDSSALKSCFATWNSRISLFAGRARFDAFGCASYAMHARIPRAPTRRIQSWGSHVLGRYHRLPYC